MKAIGYIRVSTDEQALGPEAQRQAIERWAAGNGADLAGFFEDIGVSGGAALDERPGLMAAVEALEAGTALVAAKRDRLARDVMNAAMIERLAERAGAKVITADGVGAGDGPDAALFRHIIDAFAEYERAVIRARTRAALAVKKARGEALGRPGFGFELRDGRLAVNAAEAATVDRIKALRAEGLTLQAIADTLNAEAIPTKRGGKWAPQTVKNLVEGGAR